MLKKEPTYTCAVNILRLYLLLNSQKRPFSKGYVLDYLKISNATLQRYVKAVNKLIGPLIKYKYVEGKIYYFLEDTK